ncbi:hypothetical protein VE01_00641 [Pseudogymnoascus verrucosus]|uniref:Major facilitator superfamily (MFS) profile domain-containing protein n=1 Tax=Pseudogymnoascus verrucosus TaxID=342668 RepID=A0A2P2SWJ4_9PEZI|nr:uncharacterized protein VE01_00641 [Pseudogymnoascus verrucosus]OBU01196.1 hypothetical protein VE01_00641 [Pseudogymnoascus verrucosus]
MAAHTDTAPSTSSSSMKENDKAIEAGDLGPVYNGSVTGTDAVARVQSKSGPIDTDAATIHSNADLEKNARALSHNPLPPGGPNPANFPDGGRAAWLVVLGAWCAMFCSFGWINCIGIFQDYYQGHQLKEYTPSTIAWIPSMEVFLMFAGGPLFGYIFDCYGPRYLLFFGSVCHVFGLMMVSLSSEYYQFFLSQGVCSAIGASAIFYPAMNVLPTWFLRNRAAAFGIAASGSSLGGVVLPIMVTQLIPKVGFAWTMRITAFVFLGMLIVANLTIRSHIKPIKRERSIMDFVRPLSEPAYLLLCLGCFFFFFGTFIPFNFIILQGIHYGMSPSLAVYLIPIVNAVSIFGRIIPGIFADRYGRFNALIATSALSSILVLALWLPSRGAIPIILFGAFYGFSSGAFVSISPSCVAQISDVREIGVRMGTLYFIISLAGLTGNPIAGALLTRMEGEYTGVQVFCGVAMVIGTTLFVASRWIQTGFKMKII